MWLVVSLYALARVGTRETAKLHANARMHARLHLLDATPTPTVHGQDVAQPLASARMVTAATAEIALQSMSACLSTAVAIGLRSASPPARARGDVPATLLSLEMVSAVSVSAKIRIFHPRTMFVIVLQTHATPGLRALMLHLPAQISLLLL